MRLGNLGWGTSSSGVWRSDSYYEGQAQQEAEKQQRYLEDAIGKKPSDPTAAIFWEKKKQVYYIKKTELSNKIFSDYNVRKYLEDNSEDIFSPENVEFYLSAKEFIKNFYKSKYSNPVTTQESFINKLSNDTDPDERAEQQFVKIKDIRAEYNRIKEILALVTVKADFKQNTIEELQRYGMQYVDPTVTNQIMKLVLTYRNNEMDDKIAAAQQHKSTLGNFKKSMPLAFLIAIIAYGLFRIN